jgi:HK97 family phage prohead protease
MSKHTLLTREESLRARDLIRERLGTRHLKIEAAVLTKAQGEGTFVGYASTFETEPDLQGDVVAPGAFLQSIADWRARGSWPPLLWQHEFDSPAKVLGVITDMREDSRGLLVAGRLDLDHEPSFAVWKAMTSGRITSFSFAFAIISEHERWDGANVLTQLDVLDVTITPTPANLNAQLVSVKTGSANTSTTGSSAIVTWTTEPESELDRINARLDALASGEKLRDPTIADQVEELVLDVREELIRESLDRAEQAAWEERMHINMVRDPVPVRVDARMRPVTS